MLGRLSRFALLLLVGLAACKRPVVGRDFAGATITDLTVEPENARQGVPIAIRFRLDGGPQGSVTYSIGPRTDECLPTRIPDGRYECIHPEVTRQEYPQGAVDVTVKAKDRVGKETQATARVTLDFDCPLFTTLAIDPPIGRPGTTAVVTIESNELLREPPIVSRGNMFWQTATGTGTAFRVEHPVVDSDTTANTDVVVVITDLAGNKSSDCGIDGHLAFGVDREVPQVNPFFVELRRGIPGTASRLSAQPGAFTDDVEVAEVRVFDEDDTVLATLVPAKDGSLADTPLGTTPAGRVRVQAFDRAQTASEKVYISERWRVSAGMGTSADSAVRTAVRYTAAPPGSRAMDNRTRELASRIFAADTESAEITAHVGFRQVGTLPAAYRDITQLATGYDPATQSIVAFGGWYPPFYDSERNDTLIIRWNELTHEYDNTLIPGIPGSTPSKRIGTNFAFDGSGCGILFGGRRWVDEFTRESLNDTWRICKTGEESWDWSSIEASSPPLPRLTPILWDPDLRRFVIAGGFSSIYTTDMFYLDPPAPGTGWRWIRVTGLPDRLVNQDHYYHAFYYDPFVRGYGLGLGPVDPYYEAGIFWTQQAGGWTASDIPFDLAGRIGLGYAHDDARSMLVAWGDERADVAQFDPDTWFLAGDPRGGAQEWRRVNLSPSLPRAWPAMVYDSDRESTIVFAGKRFVDQTSVPPVIEELIVSPSFPVLQASLDLDTKRPPGIETLELVVRATGAGDGDGVGPGTNRAGGVLVKLYDHEASAWTEVASVDTPPAGAPVEIRASVTDRPERFVRYDGVVPVTVITRWPATEDADARLDVDVVDGSLVLAPELPRGARIDHFSIAPESIIRGRTATITWSVSNAPDGIILTGDGRTLLESDQPEGRYTLALTATATDVLLQLRALNPTNGDAVESKTLEVRSNDSPPIILSFSAARKVGARGTLMNLSWTTERATALRLSRGATELLATSTMVSGASFDTILPLDPTATSTSYVLEATSEAGRDVRQVEIRLAHETILRGPGAAQGYSGALAVVGETDLYQIDMVTPGYIDAKTFAPASPTCIGADTQLSLYDGNLEYLGYDDDEGEGNCSHIDRNMDDFALVPAGTYYLEVNDYNYDDILPAYSLDVITYPVQCGNGVKEPGEGCDDGNTNPGDGCSATCAFETDGRYAAPNDGRVVFAGTINPIGTVRSYEIDVISASFVNIELFAPNVAGGCPSADTYIQLLAEDMTTVIEYDDDDGVGSCSVIGRLLAPGTYFLLVHDYGDNTVIPAYEVVFDSLANFDFEAEPNDAFGQSTSLGTVAPGTSSPATAGAIIPDGDDDYYSFTLSAPGTVTITVFTSPTDRSCSGIDTWMTLYDSAQIQLAFNDDGNGYCSQLDGIGGIDTELIGLPAGTYYVLIQDYQDDESIGGYFLDVEVQ